jgi:hypothetical protein
MNKNERGSRPGSIREAASESDSEAVFFCVLSELPPDRCRRHYKAIHVGFELVAILDPICLIVLGNPVIAETEQHIGVKEASITKFK